MKSKLLYPAILIMILCFGCKNNSSEKQKPYIVVVSLDGFRWDYMHAAHTPFLDSIAASGTMAESLIPSFPSKTFPNHYTLATGLFPDHHGIVQNSFYDPVLDRYYEIRDRQAVCDSTFYLGEPIWVTAEKQDVKTASFFWVGSEAPIKGVQPAYWKQYDHAFPFEQRIDTVLSWLRLPEELRPHLVMLYFHEPDHTGHVYGPDADTVSRIVEYLDHLMGQLSHGLNRLDIAGNVNLIILSDHGMGNVDPEKTVYLENYIDTSWFEQIQGWNPNFCLKVKPEFFDTAYATLSNIPHIQTWKHGNVPEALNYGTHPRTLDFIVVANPGCGVMLSENRYLSRGAHGYDIRHNDMHAIFIASGPDFKSGFKTGKFSNIHIYPLLAQILKLQPAKTDGKLDSVVNMLQP